MQNITIIFKKTMKMSDLIDADYRLLLLLNRLNISLGFGEKNIDTVCKENGFDTDCFLFLANYQSNKSIMNIEETFKTLPLTPFLQYLKSSHSYFLEKRLPNIRRKLELVFAQEDQRLLNVVLNFFDNYTKEVSEHMVYEDDVVFPYVYSLIDEVSDKAYSIDIFEERHNDIEGKMNDLKQILLKYVPGTTDQMLMVNILMELYTSEEELEAHTFIEDNLVIPRVREIEKERKNA
ncbi:hemerythrin domain-containing protein [Dysgonomonas sp. Marseille-P4677]|uniref:hemerythrin domain-containing protein n=1 Tax=Dysgonomonas sp. Marseille-P4677 TaxID=2364790 RepID=UPI001912FB41|nr:hemerythrin domain-containing protein [Dysgonomonas sp. Marseille-P4677]MBK5720815.1 hemerythrin domain-containing protein [Dysgonomonas sp. Marseille-P4677]